jgi:16S rRNA (guanine966-N2)-methyltransferase
VALRVIAGSAGGRKLVAPKGGARPTTDRVKESLFSMLGPARLQDAVVLDLYAGSGALAIEALSRGAARAVLVDHDRAAEAAVRANLESTGFDGVAQFRRSTVAAFLATTPAGAPFDLVFLDPPYDVSSDELSGVLGALAARDVVAPEATVVVERAKGSHPLTLPVGWGIEKDRAYGDTLLVVAHAG